MNPKVSIITVCLNSEKFIERTIRSVLSQSYHNIEYIIIDGESKDETLNIIKNYRSRIALVISEPDKGIYDAQNKGIKLATGEIIAILNSDEYYYNAFVVEKAVMAFDSNRIDFIYGNMMCTNNENSEYYLKKYPKHIKKRYFLRGPLGHSASFFRKKCFINAGYYNLQYRISADYEWYLKAIYKFRLTSCYVDETISVFQEGGVSGQSNCYIHESKLVQKIYFSKFEAIIYKCINFITYGDFFRIFLKIIIGNKNYYLMRSRYRKINRHAKGFNVLER